MFMLIAFCVHDAIECDCLYDKPHAGHVYSVSGFTDQDARIKPFGVQVKDRNGNDLKGTFFVQRFNYFNLCLN